MERIELHCYTDKSQGKGFGFARDLISKAVSLGQKGIAITDFHSVQSFYEAQKCLKEYKDFKVIYGSEICIEGSNVVLLCKNKKGKNALFRILTEVFKNFNYNYIDQYQFDSIYSQNKDNLLLGACCVDNELINFALDEKIDQLKDAITKYDYVEVAPIDLYLDNYDANEDEITKAIKLIVDVASIHNKIIIATNKAAYVSVFDKELLNIMTNCLYDGKVSDHTADQHLLSSDEMKQSFSWLNNQKLINDIVVDNTNRIYEQCEIFNLFDNHLNMPLFNNAFDEISRRCMDRCHQIYGNNIDERVLKRLEIELKSIQDNNFSSIYYLFYRYASLSSKLDTPISTRGMAGSSFVAYLLEITSCNPLPPHYICPECHKIEWINDVASGYDLPERQCTKCQTQMDREGQDLDFELFSGFRGEKVPYLEFNVSSNIYENTDKLFNLISKDNMYIRRSGYVQLDEIQANTITRQYHRNSILNMSKSEIKGISDNLVGHYINYSETSGYIVVPTNIDIFDYTPIDYLSDGTPITHLESWEVNDNFVEIHCIENIDETILEQINKNDFRLMDIDILDKKVYELFIDNEALDIKNHDYKPLTKLGILGITGFDSPKEREIIEIVKPKKFSDLVKISSLGHSTGAWENNVEELFKKGISFDDLIATRDDVMKKLLKHKVDRKDAYEITERVRKGKGLLKEQEDLIKQHNLPDWFIDSCNKIKYLFPKAHAIEYVKKNLLFAWLKIYKPSVFYKQYIKYRVNEFDRTFAKANIEMIKERDYCASKLEACEMHDNLNVAEVIYEMETRKYDDDFNLVDDSTDMYESE